MFKSHMSQPPDLDKDLPKLQRLCDECWGVAFDKLTLSMPYTTPGGASRIRSVDYIDLATDTLSVLEDLLKIDTDGPIFIRSEYLLLNKEIEKGIKQHVSGGLVVLGQPGIGEPYSLPKTQAERSVHTLLNQARQQW
jgi:hypothetical protein